MWDDFWRPIIFVALVCAIVAGCTGCSLLGSEKMTDKEFIKALKDAGCDIKAISRDTDRPDPAIDNATCHGTVRYVR
jgi:hypothetical protein